MNKNNTKFVIKNANKTRQYMNNNKKYYYYKKIQYDNYDNFHYSLYKRKKNISYINYNNFYKEEQEKSFEKETKESNKAPSTKDNSEDKSLETNSRKQSFNNSNIDNNIEKSSSLIFLENNNVNCNGNKNNNNDSNANNELNVQKKDDVIKINLSNNEIESAFFRPKNYKEKKENNYENYYKKNNFENTVILEINVKIHKNKILYFKLRRFDDMFLVIKDICVKNQLNEYFTNFLVYTIIKALNSIYGIYNIKLKEDEIKFLKDLKKKYNYI